MSAGRHRPRRAGYLEGYYVASDLSSIHFDLGYRLRYRDGELSVSMPFEHKSPSEHWTGCRCYALWRPHASSIPRRVACRHSNESDVLLHRHRVVNLLQPSLPAASLPAPGRASMLSRGRGHHSADLAQQASTIPRGLAICSCSSLRSTDRTKPYRAMRPATGPLAAAALAAAGTTAALQSGDVAPGPYMNGEVAADGTLPNRELAELRAACLQNGPPPTQKSRAAVT